MSVERDRRGNGWIARWREQGRQRSRKFALKGDAEAFEREVKRRQQLGPLAVHQLTARGGLTLDQWVEQRWIPEHASTLAVSTCQRYANVYECHIVEPLGDVALGELTVARLRDWQVSLLKAGTNPGTVHKARTFLSSVLRHAAESEAIPGNPLSLVRAPKPRHRDAVEPLAPAAVEAIRRALLDPTPRKVAGSLPGQRRRRPYELPARGTLETCKRDGLIVSLLAYAGLRPGELRALRFADIHQGTLYVQRAADPDGHVKATKTSHKRSVRLLSPLAQDIREYRLAIGRPPSSTLLLATESGEPWDKTVWQMWRADRWAPACRHVGADPVPRPYDLRHGFASLLLAEGRQPLYVARQLGHSLPVLFSTYAHLIDEYAENSATVDAEAEIAKARAISCVSEVRRGAN